MKKKILVLIMTFVSLFFLTACGSKQLSGTYQGKFDFLGSKVTDILKFDGNTVTETSDGSTKKQTGTYSIEDNKINIKLKDFKITGEITKNHKSFIVTDATGVASMLKGTKYTHQNRN